MVVRLDITLLLPQPNRIIDEFIADAGLEGDDEDVNRRAAVNARLDRRERELNDQDLAKIAQNLRERYGRATVRYTGDMNEVPQRLLMPSVHDANLWQVRVKVVHMFNRGRRTLLTSFF